MPSIMLGIILGILIAGKARAEAAGCRGQAEAAG